MKRGRPKKQKTKENSLVVKFLFLFILLFGLFFADKIFYQFKPVKETPKTYVKNLPPKFAAELSNSPKQTNRVPIIMYHYVEYVADKTDKTRSSLNINPDIFEAQIKTLHDSGYTFMTAGEFAQALDNEIVLPQKPVVITIDDGHWDVDTVILPILKKYNAKATAYLITSFINGSDFLTEKQVRNLIDSGLVEIGAHTVHHIALAEKFSPVVSYEVNQSKKDLESKYKIKVVSFAYPDGSFDDQAVTAVKAAGFTSAVSTIPGITQNSQNKYFLFRIRPGYRIGQELIDYLNQPTFKNW